MKTVIIYALRDPETHAVRYVGATANLRERCCEHWQGFDRSTQPISLELAQRIEAALKVDGKPGYPATRENWPRLCAA